ncbi:phage tail protein [Salmonella enterica subsp. enterica serovar Typhimurium]|uniref:phage tail protein n=6 Tax=Enterobacteriaceae TaxID=543 RepID=UPI0012827010|nr:phage tail protein [Salmonella enterica]ECE6736141.1 phage tail protein [Salmonella enterica subsp. enterica]ECX5549814.1 phage tail protein [Salmonella enterica subsp. enterica serovar Typhimurium]EGY8482162.1 phage tail protein [Salmonella enterica subsp. enterica serovar Panama]HCM2611996.1 phage tail protein [Salmonella enterica subsp. enterica serovar Typhimurium var. monophasic 4,[5],12:i:-]HCS9391390.1 phage tail protein [Salmonella enterica subsp. enterica serovar 1,4,[5],12:i:-]
MTVKYYAILTNQGAARLANATMLGSKLNLTQMAVGDANGVLPTPDPAQTKLINQKRIAPLNLLSVDPNNQSQIIAEQIIPENEGGFWIREIGLYDDEGVLIAVANCPETYKPQLQEGSGRTQTIRMILVVTNTEAITLKIDPSVVLATRKYVDDKISEHEQSRRHPDASLTAKGFTQLSSAINSESETLAATPKAVKAAYDLANGKYTAQNATTIQKGIVQLSSATNSTSETLAATPKAVKAVMDETNKKAPLNSPALTGTPTTPTAPQGTNSTQIASTAFVMAAIAALVDSSPDALNTLNELAAALGNDPNFATTMTNALAGKQPKDATLTALAELATSADKLPYFTGADRAALTALTSVGRAILGKTSTQGVLDYLGLGETINLARNAVPATRRINSKPLTGDITLWASDVGALPIAGGRLNGALGIGADNALGGNSIVLGDNDTGIKQNGDGVLDIYANSAHVLRFISSLVESMVSLKVNGNAVATGEVQAGNGSSRMTNNGDIFGSVWGNSWLSLWINNNFVADVQLGAGTSVTTWNNAGSWPNTPGYVVTSVWKDNQGENIDGINYAPLQKRVGNQWYTVQGGTT